MLQGDEKGLLNAEVGLDPEDLENQRADLEELLFQREQEVLKAVEFGQSLLGRIKNLENLVAKTKKEKEDAEQKGEYLREENETLKQRIKNMEDLINNTRQERNRLQLQCSFLHEEVKKLKEELIGQEELRNKVTEYRDYLNQYRTKLEEMREENVKLRHQIKMNANRENNGEDSLPSPVKNFDAKTVLELNQKIEKLQGEKEMLLVTGRAKINELNHENHNLKSKIIVLEEKLSSDYKNSNVSFLQNETKVLRKELNNLKNMYIRESKEILQSTEEMTSIMSSITGLKSDSILNLENNDEGYYLPKNKRIASLEMSYALLQQKIIKELGLDEYYGTFGRASVYPSKKGYLKVYIGLFKNSKKWVHASLAGFSIYNNSSDNIPINRFSLQNALVQISPKDECAFEIIMDIGKDRKKSFSLTANDVNERNEWCAFLSQLLENIV